MTTERTCAVIVTYQPASTGLLMTLSALKGAVGGVVIVDNGSSTLDCPGLIEAYPSLVINRLETNEGIGVAQNEGIAVARELGFEYVLLLDQDSIPQEGMVSKLLDALESLERDGRKVACVGPRVRFPGRAEMSSFPSPSWFGRRRGICQDSSSVIECDVLISSGSLIPIKVIDAVGGLEGELFIDQVDTEWCLRARSKGYRVFGICGAILEHRLGETAQRVWAGRWRQLPRHKSFRYYYIFRNTIQVSRRPYVSTKWVLFNLRWLAALFIVYGLFSSHRMGELGMMMRGTMDGIRGIKGKMGHQ